MCMICTNIKFLSTVIIVTIIIIVQITQYISCVSLLSLLIQVVFRSASSQVFLLIQISKEMWEFDTSGTRTGIPCQGSAQNDLSGGARHQPESSQK